MPDDQAMNGDVAHALARLDNAVQALEAAINRRGQRLRGIGDLTKELDLMRADRMKLAGLLDDALSRGRALEETRRQTETRVDRAIAAVRGVVERQPGA